MALAGSWIADSGGRYGIGPVDSATGAGKAWRGRNISGDFAAGEVVLYGGDSLELSKAEDAAHSSADRGIMGLAVRQDTPGNLSGTDGDYEPLQVSAGRVWTSALITSLIPGVAATSLGKAEDAAHTSGDTGVMALVVRQDTAAQLAGTDGDYSALINDSAGRLHVTLSGLSLTDDAAFTVGTSKVMPFGAMADESGADSVDEGDVGIPRMTLARILRMVPSDEAGASIYKVDDAAFTPGTSTLMPMGALADEAATDSVDEGDVGIPRMTLSRILWAGLRAKGSASADTELQSDGTGALRASLYGKDAAAGDTALPVVSTSADLSSPGKALSVVATLANYDGGATSLRLQRTIRAVATADLGANSGSTGVLLYNTATFDAQRNNTEGTLLASAARTAGATGASIVNYNARGIILFLNVTVASGTGGLQVRCRAVDPISGNAFSLNAAPTVVTATGQYGYIIYPGAATAAGSIAATTQTVLPRTFQVVVDAGDGSSYTYSLGYALIV